MHQRKLGLQIAAVVVWFVSALLGTAHAQGRLPQAAAEGGRLWFVELTGAPVADGRQLNIAEAEKAAFRRNAAMAGIRYTERRVFSVLFNGFSVVVDPKDRAKLMEIPGVKAIYPVAIVRAPRPEVIGAGSAADLATALAMTGANTAQDALKLTGAGIKVGVMDTGIDIDHPGFGGGGVPGGTPFANHPRIKYGWDFVGDKFNADPDSPAYNPVPVPDNNPDDCNGHGTHVAGIVGANDATVKGVAPGVTFGAYRVFGCDGSTTTDIMIAAMERALADGMHVLNISIGSAYEWPRSPTARAADRLVNKGMVVVASIGNSGATGLYSAGAPGVGQKVIGTASFDNTHLFLPYFIVNGQNIAYLTMTFSPPAPTSGTEEIVWLGRGCVDGDLVTPGNQTDPYLADPNGKVALVQRGVCGFAEKAIRAIAAGATAVVVQNNAAGVFGGTLGAPLPNPKPVVGISQADGDFIRTQAAPVMMTWTNQQAAFESPTAGLISSFSSYGLSPDLALKPDIGAPGGNIYSTYPLEKGGYASISGTSMASPHVAGGVALLLQAKPKTPAQTVRTIMQNSADPKVWSLNPALGLLDHAHRQGAGLVDIDDAILATTRIEPGKIAAGEGEAGAFTQTLTITNAGTLPVTYNLSFVNAVSTGGVITPSFAGSNASVAFSAPSISVPANSSATVDATITPATGPVNGQYGGYVVLTDASDPGKVFRVPFAGFVGDYQGIQVLTPVYPAPFGFPWLSKLTGGEFYKVPEEKPGTYTMVGDDIPYFLVHFDHQSRRARFEAFDAVTGKAWHRVSDDEYLPRNATTTGFFTFAWDGTTFTGKGKNPKQWRVVPNGQYVVRLSVLKALGDENNPAHWEIWTSPTITIARPPAP